MTPYEDAKSRGDKRGMHDALIKARREVHKALLHTLPQRRRKKIKERLGL